MTPAKATIQILASAAADDETLVADLTRLVNDAYGEAEGDGIYKAAFERTSASVIEALLRAGELAVAFLRSTDADDDDDDDDEDEMVGSGSRPSVPEGRGRRGTTTTTTTPHDDGGGGGRKPVGCVYIKRVSPTTGEFGMLAVDPTCRGTGLGRDLVRFAEERCRRDFGLALMHLELLVPVHFEHAGKTRLQVWYTRLGYVLRELRDFGEAHPKLNALLAGPTEYRVFEKELVA
ncbi:hypothetical protein F4782DRAFT_264038 [Xylaria castorea]|nr:hypothetical protein F4782DRAFT_264038 [Xylaria castorea]